LIVIEGENKNGTFNDVLRNVINLKFEGWIFQKEREGREAVRKKRKEEKEKRGKGSFMKIKKKTLIERRGGEVIMHQDEMKRKMKYEI